MIKKRFKKEDFEGCPRFIPFKRRNVSYNLFDIVDTEKLDYVGFINPYSNIRECNRDCNIMNVVNYLLKEMKGDVE